MKLHWSPRSPFVRKVMIVAHERGIADRLDCVRTVAAMTTPHAELMKDNPLSKIPTLVLDDGTVLYDSPVICEYLDALDGKPQLFPPERAARLIALRRQALGDGFLDLLVLARNERLRAATFGRAPGKRCGAHNSRAGEPGRRSRCARRVGFHHRPYRGRLRARLSRFPLCRTGLAQAPRASCRLAWHLYSAAIGAGDASGRRFVSPCV
jgi:glutathione S-transferase